LRFIYRPDDPISFARIINLPPRGLGEASLARLEAWRRTAGAARPQPAGPGRPQPAGPARPQAASSDLERKLSPTSSPDSAPLSDSAPSPEEAQPQNQV